MNDQERKAIEEVFREGVQRSDFPVDFDPRQARDEAWRRQKEAEKRLETEGMFEE